MRPCLRVRSLQFAAKLYVAAALGKLGIVCGIKHEGVLAGSLTVLIGRLNSGRARGPYASGTGKCTCGNLVGIGADLKDAARRRTPAERA